MPKDISIITLGCSKNLVDSEVLSGQLVANGHSVSHETNGALPGTVIINTCGFIENAKQESIDTILKFADKKKSGELKNLIVTGCLSERYRHDLSKEIAEVDGWFGTHDMPDLLKALKADYKHELIGERKLSTPSHYAYLKISEGCNRTCAFCAIPLMRGQHISKPMEQLAAEAKSLARYGVKELMLIAQELTYYGLDIYKKRKLPELLNQLADVEGIDWLRLHYAYPSKFPVEVLDVIRERPTICNYLDIPLQHASDNVLNRMRRQITRSETEQLLDTIREKVPGIAIRTTMLVGFPGETDDDFDRLLDFVQAQRFERLGVFEYSHEEGTSGYELDDDVPPQVKAARAAELMAVQQEISLEKNAGKVGQTYKVLIDRKEGNYFVGRTEFDSPEVDNEVLVSVRSAGGSADTYLRIGDFADIKITDATEFDLYGVPALLTSVS
jgi:ribosomal protein S12 methylthiotransferase